MIWGYKGIISSQFSWYHLIFQNFKIKKLLYYIVRKDSIKLYVFLHVYYKYIVHIFK